jgi:hypothetical protein
MAEENGSEEEDKGFKVSDKRFSVRGYEDEEESAESGPDESEIREAPPAEVPGPPVAAAEPAPPGPPGAGEEEMSPDGGDEPPAPGEVSREFETLLAILQGNAVSAMGLNPQTGERVGEADPRTAKMFVDMISMVKEKMAGNLAPEEDALVSRVISDLKMMYVQQVGLD